MGLKAQLENLDGIDETIAALYVKNDKGVYTLPVEGLVDKSKVDEFRDNNIALQKAQQELQDKFKGVDLEEYTKLKDAATKNKDKKLIDEGKIDELVAERTERMRKELETENLALKNNSAAMSTRLEKLLIDNAVQTVAVEAGAKPTALEDITHRARQTFKLEGDKVVAYNGDKQKYGADGVSPLSVGEYMTDLIKVAPHLFEASKGGGGTGSKTTVDGKKSMARSDFDALDQMQRNSFIKDNGVVTD